LIAGAAGGIAGGCCDERAAADDQAMILPSLAAALVLAAPQPADATVQALNAARAAHGVAPLRGDARLAQAALRHSRDMVARHYFSHVTPGGATLGARVARTGWTRLRPEWQLGEDLAWVTDASADTAVAAWLHSPPHRRVLLDQTYRLVGVGVADGTPFGMPGGTFTADFGS
jgi:uncharacterized protein YkwD